MSNDMNEYLFSRNLHGSVNPNDVSNSWYRDKLYQDYVQRENDIASQVNHYEEMRKSRERAGQMAAEGIARVTGGVGGDYVTDLARNWEDTEYVNIDDLRADAYKQAAQHDFGGITGRAIRSTSAQFAGSRELADILPEEIRGQLTDEFFAALANQTGTSGSTDDWGAGASGTTIGKMFSGMISAAGFRDISLSNFWNIDAILNPVGDAPGETNTDRYYMRGSHVGSPLWMAINQKDKNWTPEVTAALADQLLGPDGAPTEAGLVYARAGIDRATIANTHSYGHFAALMNDKMTSYRAGRYMAQATGWEQGTFFLGNMGRIILSDPDMAVEFGLASGRWSPDRRYGDCWVGCGSPRHQGRQAAVQER